MKFKVLTVLMLSVLLIAGCGASPLASPSPTLTPAASPSASETSSASPGATDVATTASIVNDNAAFEAAISKTGTWIIATLKDLTFDKDLTLDGDFTNGKKDANGKDIVQRKIALYTQDANRKVTNRFTLTAPKLTVNSPNASIQHGTFKGDVYVNSNNFQLVDATVDGNIYFASDAVKQTFTMDATSKVTGQQAVK